MAEIIKSIIVTENGPVDLSFERLPLEEPVYAVYCDMNGREHCFHMMYDDVESNEFRIIDKRNCPYALHELEHMLSKAIEHHHL